MTDSDIRVLSEPRTYSLRSPHSYVLDVARIARDGWSNSGAAARMTRYGQELACEIDAGSREGRRAERALRASCRESNASKHEQTFRDTLRELRNLPTGGGVTVSASGGSAAAFVSPFFMWQEWAPYRGIDRTFADQTNRLPLPSFGMQVYLPYFTSGTGVTAQTEGQAVAETDPGLGLQASGAVQTLAGQITLTQQVQDRAASGGGSFDRVMGEQLLEQLDQQVDVYTLTQALAAASTVIGNSSFSMSGLYQDLARGREQLTDMGGTRLRPSHLFTTSDFYSYVTRQIDTSGRPILQPWFTPGVPLEDMGSTDDERDGPNWSRFTGNVLPGSLLWFTDDNIPTFGTTNETQLIISSPQDSVLLLEDDPVMTAFPETNLAGSLEVILTLRQYTAVIVRHAFGTASVTGVAYQSSLI